MPTAKDIVVRRPDAEESQNCMSWPIWSCQPSQFDWDYTQTETSLVMEGRVTVTDRPAGVDAVTFGPGDLVIFPVGLRCIWNVELAVRKHYDFS